MNNGHVVFRITCLFGFDQLELRLKPIGYAIRLAGEALIAGDLTPLLVHIRFLGLLTRVSVEAERGEERWLLSPDIRPSRNLVMNP